MKQTKLDHLIHNLRDRLSTIDGIIDNEGNNVTENKRIQKMLQ